MLGWNLWLLTAAGVAAYTVFVAAMCLLVSANGRAEAAEREERSPRSATTTGRGWRE